MTRPAVPELPEGFHVRLNPRTKVYDGGRTLVGGAPATAAFLTEAAGRMLDGRAVLIRDAGSRALVDRLLELGMADPVVAGFPAIGPDAVTVVIPVRDRPRQLDLLLHSLLDGVRVIVVDDCSADPETIASVSAAHGADLVRHPVNLGPAAARNTGLEQVRTTYVAFIDSDIVVEPDTLPTLLRHFHDPRVALVAPRILGRSAGARETWITRYENGRASLDLGRHPALVRPRAPVAWLPTACVVARVAVLGDGFDDSMRVGEDVDLVWRLARQGWRVRYEPAVAVYHENRPGLAEWWTRKLYYGTGAQPLAERHGSTVAPAVLSPWASAFATGVLLQRRWSWAAAGFAALSASRRIADKVGASDQASRISLRLTAGGAAAAMMQTSALILRHWWPAAAVGSAFSRRVRRAVATAAIVDSAIEYVRTDSDLDPLRFAIARRLDDLAYGTGVWLGALRRKSVRCLLPEVGQGNKREHDPGRGSANGECRRDDKPNRGGLDPGRSTTKRGAVGAPAAGPTAGREDLNMPVGRTRNPCALRERGEVVVGGRGAARECIRACRSAVRRKVDDAIRATAEEQAAGGPRSVAASVLGAEGS